MSSKISSHASSHHRSNGGRHRSAGRPLFLLHILNAIFSLVSITLFAAIIPIWNSNFFHSSGVLQGDWPDCLPLIPLLSTFIISLVYLIKLALIRIKYGSASSSDYLKSRSKPSASIHNSKLHLYLILTILVLLLTFLILAGICGLYRFWRPAIITSTFSLHLSDSPTSTLSTLSLRHISSSMRRSVSDSNPLAPGLTPPTTTPQPTSTNSSRQSLQACTLANVFTRRCNPTLYLIGDLQIAAISTGTLVWLLNLILFTLQLREHQYQKRKLQRSLRVKAKAKLDFIIEEDELSRSEKGIPPKKIHHPQRAKGHAGSSSSSSSDFLKSNLHITPTPNKSGQQRPPARPPRAATTTLPRPDMACTSPGTGNTAQLLRPKQHHYNPTISPSRARRQITPGPGVNNPSSTNKPDEYAQLYANHNHTRSAPKGVPTQIPPQTPYVKAVEEARKKVKPAETMRDWMAGRYV